MKMKRLIAAVLAALMIVVMIPAAALTVSAEGEWEYTTREDGTILLTAYTGTIPATMTIPAKYDGKDVYGIASQTLYGNAGKGITTVVVEEGVQYIGDWCFPTGVTSYQLPSTLREIGSGAFFYTKATAITLPVACMTFSVDTECANYANKNLGNSSNRTPFYNAAANNSPMTVTCYSNEAVKMLEEADELTFASTKVHIAIDRQKAPKAGGVSAGTITTDSKNPMTLDASMFTLDGNPHMGVSDTSNIAVQSVSAYFDNDMQKLFVTAKVHDEKMVHVEGDDNEWESECFELVLDPNNEFQSVFGRDYLLQLRINTQNKLSGRWFDETIGGAESTLPTGSAFDGKFVGSVAIDGAELTYTYEIDISEFAYETGDQIGFEMHAVSVPDATNPGWQYASFYKRADGGYGVWNDAPIWDYFDINTTPTIEDNREGPGILPLNDNTTNTSLFGVDGWCESTYSNAGFNMDDAAGYDKTTWWPIANGFYNKQNDDFCLQRIAVTLSKDAKTLYFYAQVNDPNVEELKVGPNPWETKGFEFYLDPYGNTDPYGDYEKNLIIIRMSRTGELTGSWLGNTINVKMSTEAKELRKPSDYDSKSPYTTNTGTYIDGTYKLSGETKAYVVVRNAKGTDHPLDQVNGWEAGSVDEHVYYEGSIDVSAFNLKNEDIIAFTCRALDYSAATGATFNQLAHRGYQDIMATNYWRTLKITNAEWLYEVNDDGTTCKVTKYTGANTTITVPSTVDGYTVTGFTTELFSGNNQAVNVILPDTIESLPDCAFGYCRFLQSVKCPTSLKVLPDKCFYMSKMTSFNIPAALETIGMRAFRQNTLLKTVTFESGSKLKTICNQAFTNCFELTEMTIPEGVTRIEGGSNAESAPFQNCRNMKKVVLPSTLTALEMNTFTNCYDPNAVCLQQMVVKNPDMEIPEGAIVGCYKLSIYAEKGSKAEAYCRDITDFYNENDTTGYYSGALFNCDTTLTDLHHVLYVVQEPTEASPTTMYKCAACDFRYTQSIYKDFTCSNDSTHSGAVAKTHDFTVSRTVKAPTCTEDGYSYVVCKNCGLLQSYNYDGEGVDPQINDNAAKETLLTSTKTAIAATGHTWGDWVTVTAGDCSKNEETIQKRTCSKCGESEQRNSLHDTETVRIDAGYSHPGSVTETCKVCETVVSSEVLPQMKITDKFKDVKENEWYAPHLALGLDLNLISGTTNTTFSPDADTTRGTLVVLLYRMENSPAVNFKDTFTDVKQGEWYANAVMWAYENGITTGTSATTFGPNRNITRQEIAALLYRYTNQYKKLNVSKTGDISGFADVKSIEPWATDAFAWANGMGIITGTPNNTLSPKMNASRAQVITMLSRFVTAYPEAIKQD